MTIRDENREACGIADLVAYGIGNKYDGYIIMVYANAM